MPESRRDPHCTRHERHDPECVWCRQAKLEWERAVRSPQGEDHEAGIEAGIRAYGRMLDLDEAHPDDAVRAAITAYLSRRSSPERHARGQRGYVADCKGCGSRFKRADLAERHADFTGHELIWHTAPSPERDTVRRIVEYLHRESEAPVHKAASTRHLIRALAIAVEREFGVPTAAPERDTERLVAALREIANRPTVERNPDGDDQAAWTMQLIAREALAEFESSDAKPPESRVSQGE